MADHDDHAHSHLGDMDVRVRALETLLTHKGYIDPAALDAIIETCTASHIGRPSTPPSPPAPIRN